MLATVVAANIRKVQIKKFSVFTYSEAEPHAMYAIYKQTRTLCVLSYLIVTHVAYHILEFCNYSRWLAQQDR